MRPISKVRFDALGGYARTPAAGIFGEELAYFEHANERVLGMLLRDRTDNDYMGAVFARDELLQFRFHTGSDFTPTPRHAKALLRRKLEAAALEPNEAYRQGHKKAVPVDFFTPVVPPNRLNPSFSMLIGGERYSSAREIIEPMMRWYDDADGNFVEQFQTTGFDQRIWELYLFALLIELGFQLNRTRAVPDFFGSGLRGQIAIEAATVNPTRPGTGALGDPPDRTTEEGWWAFRNDYMPIKFGSSLYSKLQMRYWSHDHIKSVPLVFAIQDFSSPGSMTSTTSSLPIYLYGMDHDATRDEAGRLVVTPRRVVSHNWRGKSIPSGFFSLPEAENVSAVLINTAGTISKFCRIGRLAGFGSERVTMIRRGTAIDPDPDAAMPQEFAFNVGSRDYRETWVEGCTVFHNPNAAIPLDPNLLPGATHLVLRQDDQLVPIARPAFHPLASHTALLLPEDEVERDRGSGGHQDQ